MDYPTIQQVIRYTIMVHVNNYMKGVFHTMSINLSKEQKVSLVKQDGSSLGKVLLGLGWDEANAKSAGGFFKKVLSGGGEIDLDASAIFFDAQGRVYDTIYYGQQEARDGHTVGYHTGDNLTGAGDGDDEQIILDLTRVPSNVDSIALVINSYSGQKFSQVKNVFVRVEDTESRNEILRYSPSLGAASNATGLVLGKLKRNMVERGNSWL